MSLFWGYFEWLGPSDFFENSFKINLKYGAESKPQEQVGLIFEKVQNLKQALHTAVLFLLFLLLLPHPHFPLIFHLSCLPSDSSSKAFICSGNFTETNPLTSWQFPAANNLSVESCWIGHQLTHVFPLSAGKLQIERVFDHSYHRWDSFIYLTIMTGSPSEGTSNLTR